MQEEIPFRLICSPYKH